MNAKTVIGVVLAGLWWSCAALNGQEATPQGIEPPPVPQAGSMVPPNPPPDNPLAAPVLPPQPTGLSDWIIYRKPNCCSPGSAAPFYSEVFLHAGPMWSVGGNYLGRNLLPGWTLQGGVRGLIFNEALTKAWVLEAAIVNSNNSGIAHGDPTNLNIFLPDATGNAVRTNILVTPRNSNRTLVGLGSGWEWYLWNDANSKTGKWRVGVDGGGRWGSQSMTFNEIRHRTDVIGALYGAAHTDYEIPWGCCYFYCGLRAEWAYTWSDILQRPSDVQEISVMMTFGVRY